MANIFYMILILLAFISTLFTVHLLLFLELIREKEVYRRISNIWPLVIVIIILHSTGHVIEYFGNATGYFVLGSLSLILLTATMLLIAKSTLSVYVLAETSKRLSKEVAEKTKELKEYSQNLEEMAEERARELFTTEEKYRNLVESMGEGIWMVDEKGRITMVNKRMGEILGYKTEEMIGKDLRLFFDEASRKKLEKEMKKEKRGGASCYELTAISGGRPISLLVTDSPLFDAELNYIGDFAVVQDETERRELQEELLLLQDINSLLDAGAPREEVFQTIVDGLVSVFPYSNAAIYVLDEDEDHAVCKAYHVDSEVVKRVEKLTGLKAMNYAIPLYDSSILSEVVKGKKPIITQDTAWTVRSHTKDKTLQALAPAIAKFSKVNWGIAAPLLSEDRVVGIIGSGSTVELTETDADRLAYFGRHAGLAIERAKLHSKLEEHSKELERKVTERTKEIAETKDFLDNVIESSADAIVTTNLDGKITSWSKGAEDLYKFKAEEVMGKPVLSIYPKELQSERVEWLDRLLKGKSVRNVRTKIYDTEGRLIDISLSLSLLRNSSGNPMGTVGISKDISKEIEAEKRLREAYESLLELDKMKDEFLSNVSHELKTPITSILASLDLLSEEPLEEEQANLLVICERNTRRLEQLVGDLLEFSQLRGKELKSETMNASEIIRKIGGDMKHFASAHEVEVEILLDKELVVTADKRAVELVLTNLIGNAIKFNREGGKVMVSAEEEDSMIQFCVEDTGMGIPEKELEKVFDKFYQVDASIKRKYPGTGLGLAITKEIMEAQGGRIWAESELGKGSKFYFTLPRGDERKD